MSNTRNYVYPNSMVNGISNVLNKDVRDNGGADIDFSYSRTFKNDVRSKLPERKPISTYHPDWLKDVTINFIAPGSNLDIRYLSDGAGYRNAVGYFIYQTDTPPTTISELDLHLMFPNASRNRKRDGKLQSGDTIQIPFSTTTTTSDGKTILDTVTSWVFPSGYSVGFFIVANGWNGSEVSTTAPIYFSLSGLNPESTQNRRYHTVAVLSDIINDTLIVGFEDLNRDSWTDDDFNDFVFTAQPTALSYIDRDTYNATNFNNLEGTIIANDEFEFADQHNDCDYNDLVTTYQIRENLTGDEYTITSWVMDFHFTHRGSWHDHEFGLIIPNLHSQTGTASRKVFIGDSNTLAEDVDITSDVFSGSNLDDKVVVATSTKTLLPPNPNLNNQFCNTWNNWDTAENRVAPSTVRIEIIFSNVVNRTTFNDLLAPFTPYLKVFPSGDSSVITGSEYERREDELLGAPPSFSGGGVSQLRPLYILRGEPPILSLCRVR